MTNEKQETSLRPVGTPGVVRSSYHQAGAYRIIIQVDIISDTGFNAPAVLDSTIAQTQQVVRGLIPGAKVAGMGELAPIEMEGK